MMTPISDALLAFILPGHTEWLVLLVLGLLIFGRRLPEVGRSLGRGIVEFKRGIKGIEDEVEGESSRPPLPKPAPPEKLVNRRSATGGSGASGGGTAAAPEKASRTRDPETVAARDDATESDDDNG